VEAAPTHVQQYEQDQESGEGESERFYPTRNRWSLSARVLSVHVTCSLNQRLTGNDGPPHVSTDMRMPMFDSSQLREIDRER
jgi:hypothetical protein